MVNWQLSEGCFPAQYILVANGQSLSDARPDITKNMYYKDITILISNSEKSISSMYDIPPLPSECNFERYARFKNRLNDEIVTVTWKYLALALHAKGSKPHKEISTMIDTYLEKNKLPKLNDKSKANIITAIIKQWDRNNLLEFPFLTTGADAPPKLVVKKRY